MYTCKYTYTYTVYTLYICIYIDTYTYADVSMVINCEL